MIMEKSISIFDPFESREETALNPNCTSVGVLSREGEGGKVVEYVWGNTINRVAPNLRARGAGGVNCKEHSL